MTHTPRIRFVIGGVQKGGTTAMAHCLSLHPEVALPSNKEAHVFDAGDFDENWGRDDIDRIYAKHFQTASPDALHGDATPIYCMHERIIARIARYNPAMKWIVLLRNPVERAISQYHMERNRGDETWPMPAAMLLERWRLHGHYDDWSAHSPLRHHSYLYRGDYARQLDALLAHFDSSQLLLLHSAQFLAQPKTVLDKVYRHLGIRMPIRMPESVRLFSGNYPEVSRRSLSYRLIRWLARRSSRQLERKYAIRFD